MPADRTPAPVPPAAPAEVHEAAMEAYFREYRIAGGNPVVSRRALEAMVNTAWAAGREPAADAILKREYDRGVAAGRTPDDARTLAIVAAEPWLLHRPAECVNVRCSEGRWCIGCDPNGETDCAENPWPCRVVREQNPVWAAGRTAAAAAMLRKIALDVVGLPDPTDVHDDERLRFGAIRRALTEGTDHAG